MTNRKKLKMEKKTRREIERGERLTEETIKIVDRINEKGKKAEQMLEDFVKKYPESESS